MSGTLEKVNIQDKAIGQSTKHPPTITYGTKDKLNVLGELCGINLGNDNDGTDHFIVKYN